MVEEMIMKTRRRRRRSTSRRTRRTTHDRQETFQIVHRQLAETVIIHVMMMTLFFHFQSTSDIINQGRWERDSTRRETPDQMRRLP